MGWVKNTVKTLVAFKIFLGDIVESDEKYMSETRSFASAEHGKEEVKEKYMENTG